MQLNAATLINNDDVGDDNQPTKIEENSRSLNNNSNCKSSDDSLKSVKHNNNTTAQLANGDSALIELDLNHLQRKLKDGNLTKYTSKNFYFFMFKIFFEKNYHKKLFLIEICLRTKLIFIKMGFF